MHKVLLIGGGKIGRMIASFLTASGDYRLTVADRHLAALAPFADRKLYRGIATQTLDATDPAALRAAIAGHDHVISAGPFTLTPAIAAAAAAIEMKPGARPHCGISTVEAVSAIRLTARVAATSSVRSK